MEPTGSRRRIPPSVWTAVGAPSFGTNKLVVLWIEDPKDELAFESYFKSRGFRTANVYDWVELLGNAIDPDFMVVDQPQEIPTVREMAGYENLPIIAVTGGSDQEVFEAYHSGADMVFPRPIDMTNPVGFGPS